MYIITLCLACLRLLWALLVNAAVYGCEASATGTSWLGAKCARASAWLDAKALAQARP
jgi:hypothetical protein